mmetsp:Transcript_497/g.614  ORF Transcript_497/g.614 Transcript_497/m.614 type:complete len:359 (+) Transcript_497:170-1246(+)
MHRINDSNCFSFLLPLFSLGVVYSFVSSPCSNKFATRINVLHDANAVDAPTKRLNQDPNEDASAYDLFSECNNNSLFPMTELDPYYLQYHQKPIRHAHFERRSLDVLFPGISEPFNSCAAFRTGLRDAIRYDMISDANADAKENNNGRQPNIYGYMTDQQRVDELQRNQPLISYWKYDDDNNDSADSSNIIRMTHTTKVLRNYLGRIAPTGDEFIESIGSLCQSVQKPHHLTDVAGVSAFHNKKQGGDHAWHQDYGHLQQQNWHYQNNRHVFFGFPLEDNYRGIGVFPHLIKLKQEQWTKPKVGKPLGQPIFYKGKIPEKYIVRPQYEPGKELIVFRDIDVLHSSPDFQHRISIMRFG